MEPGSSVSVRGAGPADAAWVLECLRGAWGHNNTAAIAFYHRLGLARSAVRPDGVAASRRIKPSIPMYDEHGVAIAGEVDFELSL